MVVVIGFIESVKYILLLHFGPIFISSLPSFVHIPQSTWNTHSYPLLIHLISWEIASPIRAIIIFDIQIPNVVLV